MNVIMAVDEIQNAHASNIASRSLLNSSSCEKRNNFNFPVLDAFSNSAHTSEMVSRAKILVLVIRKY